MIRILGTIFAGLLGLAFGSFLNVCLSRWPAGESVVTPRSHCRHCSHTLAWWENVPLLSWLMLGGRCRGCKAWIGWRYPVVEAAVGVLWAAETWRTFHPELLSMTRLPIDDFWFYFGYGVFQMVLFWLLIALAVLDAEHLWLPNWVTWPGVGLGVITRSIILLYVLGVNDASYTELPESDPIVKYGPISVFLAPVWAALAAAGLILLIRWVYWLVRRREGIGLGDAKLMALLAAWLGLPQALFAFAVGVLLGAGYAMVLLAMPSARRESGPWAASMIPLGTFLCIGGIVSSLWGQRIIAAYLSWSGLG
jgi:leader peptidase (prepilin peptidase)/N-methyltransferase